MTETNFDKFKGKDCAFVADWLKTKGEDLNKNFLKIQMTGGLPGGGGAASI